MASARVRATLPPPAVHIAALECYPRSVQSTPSESGRREKELEKEKEKQRNREKERVDYARTLQKIKQNSLSMHAICHLALQAPSGTQCLNEHRQNHMNVSFLPSKWCMV